MDLSISTSIRMGYQTHPPIPQQLGSVTFNAAEVATAASADAENCVGKDLVKHDEVRDYLRFLLYVGFPGQLRLLTAARQRLHPWLHRRQTCGLERVGRLCLAVLPWSSRCAFWFENGSSPIGYRMSSRVLRRDVSTGREKGMEMGAGGWHWH